MIYFPRPSCIYTVTLLPQDTLVDPRDAECVAPRVQPRLVSAAIVVTSVSGSAAGRTTPAAPDADARPSAAA